MARRTPGTLPPPLPQDPAANPLRPSRRRTQAQRPRINGAYLTGQLLIAMPGMQDPRFARSVICLCSHSSEGAMGLVLNQPIKGLTFDSLLKQLKLEPNPPERRIRLVQGGPVESGRGFVLHSTDWSAEASLPVAEELAMTASLDILKALAEGGGPRQALLALGYAGWGPGQLEDEIQRNAWLNVPPDEALLFQAEAAGMWRQAMAKLKIDPALLSDTAGHA